MRTVARGGAETISLDTSKDGRTGVVRGTIPVGFRPGLPGVPTLVQTFAIPDPSAYARTVLIEALEREGVEVDAATVGPNRTGRLPARRAYPAVTRWRASSRRPTPSTPSSSSRSATTTAPT